MNLQEAVKITRDYGGFVEFCFRRFLTIFCSLPESLLPYSRQTIKDALGIVSEYAHANGDIKMLDSIRTCQPLLSCFYDDEFSITKTVKWFKETDWRDSCLNSMRHNRMNASIISQEFKDFPIDDIDFDNPGHLVALKMFEICSYFLRYADCPLSIVFKGKIPESLLPFSREQLMKALDECIASDTKNAESYASCKEILLKDFVDEDEQSLEESLNELIEMLSDKETRAALISDLRGLQTQI